MDITIFVSKKILIFDDLVLKITDKSSDDRDAVEMMRWLEGKLPAPRVISFVEEDHHRFLLMNTGLNGKVRAEF